MFPLGSGKYVNCYHTDIKRRWENYYEALRPDAIVIRQVNGTKLLPDYGVHCRPHRSAIQQFCSLCNRWNCLLAKHSRADMADVMNCARRRSFLGCQKMCSKYRRDLYFTGRPAVTWNLPRGLVLYGHAPLTLYNL